MDIIDGFCIDQFLSEMVHFQQLGDLGQYLQMSPG